MAADNITATLENLITSFANRKGKQRIEILENLLDYIISFLDPTGTPVEGWKYKGDDNRAFYEMFQEYLSLMKKGTTIHEWYDAWGDMFMSLITKGGAKGQFFTPPSLCDLIAETTIGENDDFSHKGITTTFGHRICISDPAAGSSRNLLAAHTRLLHLKQKKPYLVAEDLDLLCCKMSAVNMAVHGCYGEVICHDSISEPDKVKFGWKINEAMYPLPSGIPSIRRCDDARCFLATRMWQERKSEPVPQPKPKEPVQLSIF